MLYHARTKSSNEAQTKQIYDFCSLLIAYYSFAKHLMLLSFDSHWFHFFHMPHLFIQCFFSLLHFVASVDFGHMFDASQSQCCVRITFIWLELNWNYNRNTCTGHMYRLLYYHRCKIVNHDSISCSEHLRAHIRTSSINLPNAIWFRETRPIIDYRSTVNNFVVTLQICLMFFSDIVSIWITVSSHVRTTHAHISYITDVSP